MTSDNSNNNNMENADKNFLQALRNLNMPVILTYLQIKRNREDLENREKMLMEQDIPTYSDFTNAIKKHAASTQTADGLPISVQTVEKNINEANPSVHIRETKDCSRSADQSPSHNIASSSAKPTGVTKRLIQKFEKQIHSTTKFNLSLSEKKQVSSHKNYPASEEPIYNWKNNVAKAIQRKNDKVTTTNSPTKYNVEKVFNSRFIPTKSYVHQQASPTRIKDNPKIVTKNNFGIGESGYIRQVFWPQKIDHTFGKVITLEKKMQVCQVRYEHTPIISTTWELLRFFGEAENCSKLEMELRDRKNQIKQLICNAQNMYKECKNNSTQTNNCSMTTASMTSQQNNVKKVNILQKPITTKTQDGRTIFVSYEEDLDYMPSTSKCLRDKFYEIHPQLKKN